MLFARSHLLAGQAIPALPLALTPDRTWDERRQTALIRYYLDAGAGGLAVGVHSTQFAIRRPEHGLYGPILRLASAEIDRWKAPDRALVKVAGLCGETAQARHEAHLALAAGYHAGLLSLAALNEHPEEEVLRHCRALAGEIPLIGFYLQPAVGGRVFTYRFWRDFAEIPGVVAVKIAPFNRYQTIDVVRAVMEAGRRDVALYTGNDDNIIVDLLTPFRFAGHTRFIDGGLLGQWGVWTKRAVELFDALVKARSSPNLEASWLTRAVELTDANAAVFDSAHRFAGCLPGIHEVLRRQGLLQCTACLDPHEHLSPGQPEELTRVAQAYPWISDDSFVQANLTRWLN